MPLLSWKSMNVCPHQYLAKVELIVSQSHRETLKRLIEYVKIAWAIVLIETFLPALEVYFSFHPITRLVILS